MFGVIGKWLLGGGLSGIVRELRAAYADRRNALNDADRIAADERVAIAEARLGAMQVGGLASWVRMAWALPFVIYNAKLVLWDKVLGWGVTDPLSAELYYVQMVVIGFYFLTSWGVDRL